MNTTQTQALAPSSTHPGAATAAATPTHFPLTARRASAMSTPQS